MESTSSFSEKLTWLRSEPGRQVMAELEGRELTGPGLLPALTRLRQRHPPAFVAAAIEQAQLRYRAREKFSDAGRMYFLREALEQATGEIVANYRASRFARYDRVADLCCGIGGDSLALARAGCRVTAIDRDADRLAAAGANADALGLAERIAAQHADLSAGPPPGRFDAIFCDPARRSGGRRRFHPDEYEPPLSRVLQWGAAGLAVKMGPGIAIDSLDKTGPHQLEFISLDGDLKEAVLWTGYFAKGDAESAGDNEGHRATVLRRTGGAPSEGTAFAFATDTLFRSAGVTPPASATSDPLAVLYEPDAAVIRAGLVADLAARLDAAQLDPSIAYLTAADARPTPFARAWRVKEWMPFQLKRLRARLRALGAGEVTVKKRGSPVDTDALARSLRGDGPEPLVVVLTIVRGQPAALICASAATEVERSSIG